MTVSSIVPVNTYAGNGSVKRFDFDYLVENPSQLLVQLTDKEGVQTNLIFGTDYSIDKLDQKNGSFITYPLDSSTHSILASDEKITLSLDLDIEQEKEYANSSKLNLITLEYSLDYITRILQIQQRQIDRSIKIQEGSDIIPEKLVSELFQAEKNAKESEVNAKASELAAKASEDSAAATVDGFDVHALEKQGEFNANAKEKQTLINASADAAKLSELNARKYANGTIEEYPAGSAKYWADTAANIVSSGVIDDSRPSTATTYSSQKEVNTFLDKSGDTMTGALRFNDSGYIERNNSAATKGLALFGDKDGYGAGASIALRSNLASGSQAGVFKFETGNNVTGHTHTLQGSPDGSFTCDGKEIIRSINGQEADATGSISIDLSGKANIDLSNISKAGKEVISNLSMPSDKYIDLSLAPTGSTYTAPADGYYAFGVVAGNQTAFCGLFCLKSGTDTSEANIEYSTSQLMPATNGGYLILPVLKGRTVSVRYVFTNSLIYFRFIYAEGSKE